MNRPEAPRPFSLFLHPAFLAILLLKVVLGTLLASNFLRSYFIPFLNAFAAAPSQNPWALMLDQGVPQAFPYGSVMLYALAVPRLMMTWALSTDLLAVSFLHLFLARLPLLAADIAIFWMLVRWFDANYRQALSFWWASPVVIYVTYVHGQLDLIPTAILMASLVCLLRNQTLAAAAVLGLGIAAKSHLLLAVPFMILYVYRRSHSWAAALKALGVTLAVYGAALLPWALDPAFQQMVFGSEEQQRFFAVGLDYGTSLRLLFAPLVLGLLLLQFAAYRAVVMDLFLMFLGLAYTITITCLSPAHGYYIWPLPFFVYFFSRGQDHSRAPMWMFNLTCFLYLALGINSTFLDSFSLLSPSRAGLGSPIPFMAFGGPDAALVNSLLFTAMQVSILSMAFLMYRHGARSNLFHMPRLKPLMVGIGGDSGAGKHTLRAILTDVLGDNDGDHVIAVDGDDVHRWERGDARWRVVSHLNPEANDLFLELHQAEALGQGQTISRVRYDHKSGRHTAPQIVGPRHTVFFVGLHPFYLKKMRELLDIKIYVDTPDELRKAWKVRRDMAARGYTREQVEKQMEQREADSAQFIRPQKQYADIILRYLPSESEDGSELTGLEFQIENSVNSSGLMEALESIGGASISKRFDARLVNQWWTVKGAPTAEQIAQIGEQSFPALLSRHKPRWRRGVDGIVQLVFLMMLSETNRK